MRKEIVLRVTVAVLGLAGLWLAWSQNPPAPLTMQKVSDNVYVIVGDGGNVAFMHGDHTGGNEALLAANAEIIIQKNARANMVTGKMSGLPPDHFFRSVILPLKDWKLTSGPPPLISP